MDRYEEALAKARAGKSLEEIFPELKESEEERIRKWLIEEIKATHDYDSPTSRKCVDDALAYLEKQKERKSNTEKLNKPQWKPSKEQMYALQTIYEYLSTSSSANIELSDTLHKLYNDLQKLL